MSIVMGASSAKVAGVYPKFSIAGAYTTSGLITDPGWRFAWVALLKALRMDLSSDLPPSRARTPPVELSSTTKAPWLVSHLPGFWGKTHLYRKVPHKIAVVPYQG